MKMPDQYKGESIASVFQQSVPNTVYYGVIIEDAEKHREDVQGRESIGDRYVCCFRNVSLEFAVMTQKFADILDPKKRFESEDITIEKIVELK